jgi:hypothetical protein
MMTKSNGSNGHNGTNGVHYPDPTEFHPPRPASSVRDCMVRGQEIRRVDGDICEQLDAVVATLLTNHPDHAERVAAALEGLAANIHRGIAAGKRAERALAMTIKGT